MVAPPSIWAPSARVTGALTVPPLDFVSASEAAASAPVATSRPDSYQRTGPEVALYSYSIAGTSATLNTRIAPGLSEPAGLVRSSAIGVVPSSSNRAVTRAPVPATRTRTG